MSRERRGEGRRPVEKTEDHTRECDGAPDPVGHRGGGEPGSGNGNGQHRARDHHAGDRSRAEEPEIQKTIHSRGHGRDDQEGQRSASGEPVRRADPERPLPEIAKRMDMPVALRLTNARQASESQEYDHRRDAQLERNVQLLGEFQAESNDRQPHEKERCEVSKPPVAADEPGSNRAPLAAHDRRDRGDVVPFEGVPEIRSSPRDHLHVTLAFLGHRPVEELDDILGALRDAARTAQPPLL